MNEQDQEKEQAKEQSKTGSGKKESKKTILDKLNEIKGEFRKIIWPAKEALAKQTCTVIFISLLVGVVIVAMDFVFSWGLSVFSNLVS